MAVLIYNDYQLPELPKWDKTAYPYAIILKALNKDYFVLICHSNRPYMKEVDGKMVITLDVSTKLYGFVCEDKETGWSSGSELDTSNIVEERSECLFYITENTLYVWTNTDILDEDGVVYYDTTQPESFCQKSFQIGISIGRGLFGEI